MTRGDRAGGHDDARAAATLLTALVVVLLAGAAVGSDTPDGGDGGEAAPADLEALMAGMAGASGVVAEFRETKRLALLSEPLESRGTLYFVPPDRLARVTTSPSQTRLVIDGERFTFSDGASDREMDLSANPIAREVVANFIVLFNGDLDALRQRYEPDFAGGTDGWSLVLVPRHSPLRDIVARVVLEGRGRALTRMELVENGGDATTTVFEAVRTDVEFDAAERARIFGERAPAAGTLDDR